MGCSFHRFGLILVLFFSTIVLAQSFKDKAIIDSLYAKLRSQYTLCTHDTTHISNDSLLRFKIAQRKLTENEFYPELLKQYLSSTKRSPPVLPCEVFQWHTDKIHAIDQHEKNLLKTLISSLDDSVDSLVMQRILQTSECTKLDFDGIPFDISKKAFKLFFKKTIGYPLVESKDTLIAEHYPFEGNHFTVEFYFSPKKMYTMYRLHTYPYNANQLDTIVRKQASLLIEMMKNRIGEPERIQRVGLFDIKPDIPIPIAEWNMKGFQVSVLLYQKKGLYRSCLCVQKDSNNYFHD